MAWPLGNNNRYIYFKHWIVVLSMTILGIIRCEIGLVYRLTQQPQTHHPVLPIWGNPVGWTPTLEPLWRWNGDEIFIFGWEGMNYVNPKTQWMWNRRCQSTKRLYIIKNCGCRKLMCFGCVLSVCRFIVFDFCSSIELHYWVGVGDGAIL